MAVVKRAGFRADVIAAVLLVSALAAPARADVEISAAQFRLGTRYDAIDFGDDASRVQATARLGLRVHLLPRLELVSLVSSGPTYTSSWTTIHNRDGSEADDFRLYARHLYLESRLARLRLQLGTIPPVKGVVSSTGLRALGWIDGARADYDYGSGIVEIVAGQISDLDNPNTLTRDKGFNYLEVEISQSIADWLIAEASVDYLDPSPYARSELRAVKLWGPRGDLGAAAEGFVNLDNGALSYRVSGAADILDLALQRYPKRLAVEAAFGFVSSRIGLRGELSDDFYTFGHYVTVKASGVISHRHGLRWFVKNTIAAPWRFDAGLTFHVELKQHPAALE